MDELAGTQLLLLQHQLVGWSPYLSFLQRQVPRHLADRLCEYVNLIDGRHVIGLWLNRDRGVVVDLVAFHPAVDPPGYDHTLQVLFNLNNDLRVRCLQEQARRMVSQMYTDHDRWASDEADRADHRDFFTRHLPNPDKRKDPRWLATI